MKCPRCGSYVEHFTAATYCIGCGAVEGLDVVITEDNIYGVPVIKYEKGIRVMALGKIRVLGGINEKASQL